MKNSRESILAAIAKNKPPHSALPEVRKEVYAKPGSTVEFTSMAINIGSRVFPVKSYLEIEEVLRKEFAEAKRIVSRITEIPFSRKEDPALPDSDPHNYNNVDLAILEGTLGVAENSAIWVPEDRMGQRVLPFICQHLALIIKEKNIVQDMHEAYIQLGSMEEGYGAFIAGPSKTADIEQSLVLGAHGPRSLAIFILER